MKPDLFIKPSAEHNVIEIVNLNITKLFLLNRFGNWEKFETTPI